MIDISIIIVNYKVKDLLRECLQSIQISAPSFLSVETIVVDNDSQDGSEELVAREFPTVRYIANKTNNGFAKACNQGAAHATGRYLFFVNPDAALTPNSLTNLVEFMDEQPSVGIVGPRIEYVDGTIQPSCRTLPTVPAMAMILLKLHHLFPNALPLRRYGMHAFKHETMRKVDQLMGAALFIRRECFEQIGGWDERYFIWFEDVDICKSATDGGWLVMFYPEAVVKHGRSKSFSQKPSTWRQSNFAKSMRVYFWKHRGWLPALLISALTYISLVPTWLLMILSKAGLKFRKRSGL